MMFDARSLLLAACLTSGSAIVLSACSSSGPSLVTGTLLPSSKPKVEAPVDRATRVAATSAEAERCGYGLDPAQFRASYLAFEQAQGTPPAELPKVEQTYDQFRARLFKAITKPEDYCTDAKTAEIKRDLTRHRAGDFRTIVKVQAPVALPSEKPLDREKIFNPMTK